MSLDVLVLARALGGEASGGQVLAPGPGHSARDRSLAVRFDRRAPDGFVCFSHAGDPFEVCRDHVKRRLGSTTSAPRSASAPPRPKATSSNDADRTSRALALWREAGELDCSPGALWLRRRGVDLEALPRDIHRALRWHPRCPWEGGRHGCMVGLFSDAVSGEPKAIHRTAITAAGAKVGRKALGPIAGCVVKLSCDEDVLDGLVIGEGIETVLGAATRIEHRGALLQPAWAAGFAGNLAKLPVLAGIECLTILVDNDESGTGQRAAAECSSRWTAAGREVRRLVPRQAGTDFNDIIEVVRNA